jgi:hypothetical protein
MVQVYDRDLTNVGEVREVSMAEANMLLAEGWVLISVHTGTTLEDREVVEQSGKKNVKPFPLRSLVYVLGKLRDA